MMWKHEDYDAVEDLVQEIATAYGYESENLHEWADILFTCAVDRGLFAPVKVEDE